MIGFWIDGLLDTWINGETASMIRIACTFEIDEKWIEEGHWKGNPGELPGLGIILDAEETRSFLVEPGSTVRIHRPDGTFIDRIANGVSPPGMGSGWAFGLFLSNTEQHEVPAESQVELPPFCIPLFPPAT